MVVLAAREDGEEAASEVEVATDGAELRVQGGEHENDGRKDAEHEAESHDALLGGEQR